jgi:hypothetical protein
VIQLFLGFVVLGFALACRGSGGVSEAALGRGLPLGASRIASISLFRYSPADPIYLKGWIPFRLSLIFTAADDIPRVWAISSTVISSIFINIHQKSSLDQVKKEQMLQHCHILLYNCIVNFQKNYIFFENFALTLDYPFIRVYIVYMLHHCNE